MERNFSKERRENLKPGQKLPLIGVWEANWEAKGQRCTTPSGKRRATMRGATTGAGGASRMGRREIERRVRGAVNLADVLHSKPAGYIQCTCDDVLGSLLCIEPALIRVHNIIATSISGS